MQMSVADAGTQLSGLVRRSELWEEFVLIRDGHAIVQLATIGERMSELLRGKFISADAVRVVLQATTGIGAAPSEDLVYGEEGLQSDTC